MRAATIYTGGALKLYANALSEIAYQRTGASPAIAANENAGILNDSEFNTLKESIDDKNTEVASDFGIKDVDIVGTEPTNLMETANAAGDNDEGKLAVALAAVSQIDANAPNKSTTNIISELVENKDITKTVKDALNTLKDSDDARQEVKANIETVAAAVQISLTAIETAVNTIRTADATTLTIGTYIAAGIIFDEEYLAKVNAAFLLTQAEDKDTIGKIRDIVNSVVFEITIGDP
ncbi:MAG: hypothetical protein FXV80_05905, partial [Candidatus Thioglobus sp.]